MKKYKIKLYKSNLDEKPERVIVVECESGDIADSIRWAMWKTFNLYGSVLEVEDE